MQCLNVYHNSVFRTCITVVITKVAIFLRFCIIVPILLPNSEVN